MKGIGKNVAILLIVAAMVFSFAGCGDNNKMNEKQTALQTQTSSDGEAVVHDAPTQAAQHEEEHSGSGDIGYDKAKSIVLAKVPGSTEADLVELEKEHDDGRIEYEGSIYFNGYEYEFEIDGATGNILQWEIDD